MILYSKLVLNIRSKDFEYPKIFITEYIYITFYEILDVKMSHNEKSIEKSKMKKSKTESTNLQLDFNMKRTRSGKIAFDKTGF